MLPCHMKHACNVLEAYDKRYAGAKEFVRIFAESVEKSKTF